jgi:hypothetical protein
MSLAVHPVSCRIGISCDYHEVCRDRVKSRSASSLVQEPKITEKGNFRSQAYQHHKTLEEEENTACTSISAFTTKYPNSVVYH